MSLKSNLITTYVESSFANKLLTASRDWHVVADVMTPHVVTTSEDMSLSVVVGKMAEENISCLIVGDEGGVAGVVTEQDIINRATTGNMDLNVLRVADVMSRSIQSVAPNETVYRASKLLAAAQIKQLPVVNKDRLVGVVTQTDLIRMLASYGLWKDVDEIMNRDVATIQKERPVIEAVAEMSSRSTSSLVVLEAEEVVGIFTVRDYLKKIAAPRKDPKVLKMCDVMSSPVECIPQDYSLFSAYKVLEQKKVRRLVVKQSGRLSGIITQTDLFTAVKTKLQEDEDSNQKLLELSKNGIYVTDTAGKITYVNPALERLLEISGPDDLMGQEFLPEKFWATPEERFRTLNEIKSESLSTARELTLKTAKGTIVYVDLFATHIRNIGGELAGSQGMLHDISQQKTADLALQKAHDKLEQCVQARTAELLKEIEVRKKAEKALLEREIKYRTLFENSVDAIILLEPQIGFFSANPAALEMFGVQSEDEFTSLGLAQLSTEFQPDGIPSPQKAQMMMEEAFKEGMCQFEWTHKRLDGSEFSVNVRMTSLELNGQKILQASVRDVTEYKQMEKRLRHLSNHDGLTGIANRRHFDEKLGKEWRRLMRSEKPLSLIMLDVDLFKTYNDTYGHQSGDDVLKQISSIMEGIAKRPGDLSSRYGGEEFAIILPETNKNAAVLLANRLRANLESLAIEHSGSETHDVVTVSVGVSTTIPKQRELSLKLISAADKALYDAKRTGRNKVVFSN